MEYKHMGNLIIGSTALKELLPDSREPKDLDYFCEFLTEEFRNRKYDAFAHPLLKKWLPEKTRLATLNEIYTIKISHSYWVLKNNSWNKHIYDIVQLKKAGAKIINAFHADLYAVWEEKHGKKKIDLNKDKTEFFNEHVERIYDHDSLHKTVAYYDQPLYQKILQDDQSVAISLKKIKDLSLEDQCNLFREEIYVTALERYVIPNGYKYHSLKAYRQSLQKMITSYTKGWSATFILDNYNILKDPDIDYIKKHQDNAHFLISLKKYLIN